MKNITYHAVDTNAPSRPPRWTLAAVDQVNFPGYYGPMYDTKRELLAEAKRQRLQVVSTPRKAVEKLQDAKFIVRMPDSRHAEIKAAAKANRRSMNAEILERLDGTPNPAQLAEALMAAMHNKCFYTADGTLMSITVKRSIFDDVDQ